MVFLASDTAAIAYSNALFGAGSGPIYLTDVSCSGSETSLLQCNSDPILSSGCTHLEDAGVKCEGLARGSLSQDCVIVLIDFSFICSSMYQWTVEIGWRQCWQ